MLIIAIKKKKIKKVEKGGEVRKSAKALSKRMKIAIKREQSQVCLNLAERERFI